MDKKHSKNQDNLRVKLKSKIEGNRISRLSRNIQDDFVKDLKQKRKNARGKQRKKIDTLISVVHEKQELADEAYYNQTYAEYASSFTNGGCGGGHDNG